ncbi:hypothetical protein Ait01nite_019700 [Actinoplanes italicus]|uniref:NACHT domain-containing protein n=1 Tax=Actinoplanes italicus TaxID=113567 RepID=UPI0011B1E581|nr:hypothetical protein [Actinoplanes italicus]GIE28925.1 hypothetical protein Ait01nite_019700 [Actinoplanes italicus]
MLLGPPGGGKTTELKALVSTWGANAALVEVGRSSTEDGLRGRIAKALGKQSAPEPRLLALDATDESPLIPRVLAGAIEEALEGLPSDVHVAVSCRSAGWLPGVELVLRQQFDLVEIYDLVPLVDTDIEEFARSAGVDGRYFLDELRRSGIVDLARNPVELVFLVEEFAASSADPPSLPGSQAELYGAVCRRRVREPNELRRNPLLPHEERRYLADAGVLALVALFSGCSTFVLEGEGGPEDLTADDCLPQSPQQHFTEVLATRLFDGAGPQLMRFEHQMLAEYLAANHIVSTGITLDCVNELLGGEQGLLAPQVQAIAAWLAALAPERFGALIERDPAAFIRSRVELIDPGYRQVLVDSLLRLAGRSEFLQYSTHELGGLTYDGIDRRLQDVWSNQTSGTDARVLAVLIARRNNRYGLSATLASLSVDASQPTSVRVAAGYGVLDFADPLDVAALTRLLDVPAEADEDDELFGLGLRALRRGGAPLQDVLWRLRDERNADLVGSYSTFLRLDLPDILRESTLSTEELRESLNWVEDVTVRMSPGMPPLRGLAGQTEELRDEILITGLSRLQEPEMFAAVINVVVARLEHRHRLFDSRNAVLPELSRQSRRDLVAVLHNRLDGSATWAFRGVGLLDAEDLPWVVMNGAMAATSEDAERWRPWTLMLFDRERPEHRSVLAAVPGNTPFAELIARPLLRPVKPVPEDLDLESDDEAESPPTDSQLLTNLLDGLQLPQERAFLIFCHYIRHIGEAGQPPKLPQVRITDLRGWSLLSAEQQAAAVAAAKGYLQVATENGQNLLGTGRSNRGAYTGVQAMVLLADLGKTPDLETSRWQFWVPALVGGPFFGPDEEPLQIPMKWVNDRAHDSLLAAILTEVAGRPGAGQVVLRRVAPLLTAQDGAWLGQLITSDVTDTASAAVAYEVLAKLDSEAALALFGEQLGLAEANSLKAGRLASSAIHILGARAWPPLRDAMVKSPALAKEIVESLAEDASLDLAMLDEKQQVEFWQVVEELFPSADDPNVSGAHIVSLRERIGDIRDRLLMTLAERGTPAAVAELEQLVLLYPDTPKFRYLAARARITAAREAWTPLTPSEVLAKLTPPKDEPVKMLSVRAVMAILIGIFIGVVISTALWQREGLESSIWLAALAATCTLALGAMPRSSPKASKTRRWAVREPYATAMCALIPAAVLLLVVAYAESSKPSNGTAEPTSSTSVTKPAPTLVSSEPAVTTRPSAQVTISVTDAAPGSTLNVQGSGYISGEEVRVELFAGGNLRKFDGPYLLAAPVADANGTLAVTAVTVPDEICCAGATVQLTATGVKSHRTGERHTVTLTG